MSDFDGIDFTNVESREEESSSYIPKGDYNCIISTLIQYDISILIDNSYCHTTIICISTMIYI